MFIMRGKTNTRFIGWVVEGVCVCVGGVLSVLPVGVAGSWG